MLSYRIAGNFRELDEVEQFTNKTFANCRSYPTHAHVRKKFTEKTFAEGGYAVKFAKVFTRESFRLYGILQGNLSLRTCRKHFLIAVIFTFPTLLIKWAELRVTPTL